MSKTEFALQEIEAWLFNHDDENNVLKIGFWDLSEYTFYAVIENEGIPVTGESTYGSDSIERALTDLLKELEGE